MAELITEIDRIEFEYMVVIVEEVQRTVRPGKHEFQVHRSELLRDRQESRFCDMESDMVTGALSFDGGFHKDEPGIAKVDESLVVSVLVDATDGLACEQSLEKESRSLWIGDGKGYVIDGIEHNGCLAEARV